MNSLTDEVGILQPYGMRTAPVIFPALMYLITVVYEIPSILATSIGVIYGLSIFGILMAYSPGYALLYAEVPPGSQTGPWP